MIPSTASCAGENLSGRMGKKPCLSLRELEKQIGYDLDTLSDPMGKNITVGELVERYLCTKTGVKPNTLANYNFVQNLLKKEIFSEKKISQIKTSDAKLFLIKLQQDGKGYSTIKTVRGVLRPAFQMAVDDDVLHKNPFGFELATVVVNDSVTREAVTKDQMRKFLKFVHDDNVYCKYYEVVYILFHTGLRISEFCGLTLRDVDLENKILNIDHQIQRTANMKLVIESTKTNAGTNPKTLQYLMGHSDIGVTLNTYTHLGLEDAADELKRMEDLEVTRKELEKAKGEKPVSQKMFRAI